MARTEKLPSGHGEAAPDGQVTPVFIVVPQNSYTAELFEQLNGNKADQEILSLFSLKCDYGYQF